MSIPDYQSLMLPVLSAASQGEVRIGDVVDRLAEQLGHAQLATTTRYAHHAPKRLVATTAALSWDLTVDGSDVPALEGWQKRECQSGPLSSFLPGQLSDPCARLLIMAVADGGEDFDAHFKSAPRTR
jgi:hypothetical protein